MNNKGILTIIAVTLLAIAGIMLYQSQQKSPGEEVADSIGQAAEDIGNAASGN